MKALDELREWLENASNYGTGEDMFKKFKRPWFGWKSVLEPMLDAIEAELAEEYMELPIDADGVPIKVGDVLEPPKGCDDYMPLMVVRLMYDSYEDEWFFDGEAGGFTGMIGENMDVAGWTHHHEPTVEDVLREFAEKVTDSQIPGVHPTYEEAIAEYAKRLRIACEDA